ncbi:MAG: M48 family metallopeptidase [Clostridiales bacterium]|nr:M48 family metallopeptidase [Clostridiales bacterium]
MDYTLTRSERKTIAIHIKNGAVEVRAPRRTPKQEVDRFVASKEKWIQDKLALSRGRMEQRKTPPIYGDNIPYRGKQYPVVARAGNRIGFDGERFYLPPNLHSEQIEAACEQIYRGLAKRVLPERVGLLAPRMQAIPAAVKINGAKTRWGSCSNQKNLNFSWRLLRFPDEVIDYVIIHELAHLSEMNHSLQFWALVEAVLPNYKELRKRLSANTSNP